MEPSSGSGLRLDTLLVRGVASGNLSFLNDRYKRTDSARS